MSAVRLFAIMIGITGLACYSFTRTFRERISQSDVLPLSRSGTNQYPGLHSVFTNNTQDNDSYSQGAPIGLDFDAHLNNLPSRDYRNTVYGSEYMRLLSQHLVNGGANQPIENSLIRVSNDLNSRLFSNHRPCYRLSNLSTLNAPVRDFEVLVITGTPACLFDDSSDRFDAFMLRHSVRRTYGNRCQEFQILNDPPTRAEFEAAIIARAQSVRRNNRRLYIVYTGHGNNNGYQEGVAESDYGMQGSRRFIFGLRFGALGLAEDRDRSNDFTEDDYKRLLNRHLIDIETISIINSCCSGAAVTAIDRDVECRLGIAVA